MSPSGGAAVTPGPVLFVSNGYGEDAIAGGIVERLLATPGAPRVLAMPLVGEGRAYNRLGVEVVGPRELLPSGGLILARWANIFRDLHAGLYRVTVEQIRTIRALAPTMSAFVAVGDTYPTVLGALFSGRKVIMVGTAKSNYFVPYSWPERLIFKLFCERVFARDEPTAATLRARGVNAEWVGNSMMDLLTPTGPPLPLPEGVHCIALLPGSRAFAYHDLPVILDGVRRLGERRRLSWTLALADGIDVNALAASVSGDGWRLKPVPDQKADGLEGSLVGHGQSVLLVRGRFGDVLDAATMVVGQAGTGNEQAVGVQRPVVSFDSEGRSKPGWYRARQIGLLGEAMAVVPRSGEAISEEVLRILDDPRRFEAMQRAGVERMGPPGASERIAQFILSSSAGA